MSKVELNSIITALRRFNQFDPKMQVSTILTFLECAKAERRNEDISVQDIERLVGLKSGTASRNVYYWADGHKDMTGGHQMITVTMNSEDRRRRDLRLTAKGKTFINQLEGA
jgi:DNA-binding MarR family transcriptional regulator